MDEAAAGAIGASAVGGKRAADLQMSTEGGMKRRMGAEMMVKCFQVVKEPLLWLALAPTTRRGVRRGGGCWERNSPPFCTLGDAEWGSDHRGRGQTGISHRTCSCQTPPRSGTAPSAQWKQWYKVSFSHQYRPKQH